MKRKESEWIKLVIFFGLLSISISCDNSDREELLILEALEVKKELYMKSKMDECMQSFYNKIEHEVDSIVIEKTEVLKPEDRPERPLRPERPEVDFVDTIRIKPN